MRREIDSTRRKSERRRCIDSFRVVLFLISVTGAFSYEALASPTMTFQGRILKPDGSPIDGQSVQLRVQIKSSGGESCILYDETHTRDLRGKDGLFSIALNDGTGLRNDSYNTHLFPQVFSNKDSFSIDGRLCSAGSGTVTFTPAFYDERKVVFSFKDETMGSWESMPEANMTYSAYALEARKVGGYAADALCRVEDVSGPVNVSALSSSDYTELLKLINGTSTQYSRVTNSGGTQVSAINGAPSTPVAGSLWFDTSTHQLKYHDGTSVQSVGTGSGVGTVTSVTAGDGLAGGSFTVSGTISLPDVGTASTYYKVVTDVKGRVTSGVSSLSETDLPAISTPGKVSGNAITSGALGGSVSIDTTGAIKTAGALTSGSHSTRLFDLYDSDNSHRIRFQTPATGDLITDYALTWPETAGSSGQVLTTNGAGVLSWQAASGSPTGSAGGDLDGTYPSPVLKSIVTAGTGTKVSYDAKGRVTSSSTLDAADIPNLNWSKITAGKPTTLSGYGITDAVLNSGGVVSVQSGNDADKPVASTAGRVYLAADTRKIYRDNGASWDVVASVDTGGGGTVTGVTASGPLSSSGGAAPNITISQATASTDGYLSSADWGTFNSKLGAVADSALDEGQIWVGNGSDQAAAVTPGGDVSMSNVGSFAVTGIRGHVVSAIAPTLSGQVLRYDDVAVNYAPAFLSLADIRSTTSPFHPMFPNTSCTAKQTLNWSSLTDTMTCTPIAIDDSAVTFASRAAGQVFAGPTIGADATPTFRALTESDIPGLNASKITDGTLPIARGGTGSTDGSITGTGALAFTAGGTDQNVTLTPSGTGYTILNGHVGVGTATPDRKLHVNGVMRLQPSSLPGSPAAGDLAIDSDAGNALKFYDGSGWIAAGAGDASGKVNKAGDIMTGTLHVSRGSVTQYSTAVEHTAGDSYSGPVSAYSGAGDLVAPFHAGVYGGSNNNKVVGFIGLRRGNSSWTASPNAIASGTYLPGIGFAGQTNTTSGNGMVMSASINAVVNGTVSSGTLPTDIVFHTSATNAAGLGERMRIRSDGNVGVGIAIPEAKLHVDGQVKASGFCIDANCISSWPSGSGGQWSDGASSSINYTAGNVAIGAANATHLLTVGSSGQFKVNSSGALTSGSIASSSSITSNSGTAGYGFVQLTGVSVDGGGKIRFASGQSSYTYDTAISRIGSKQLKIDDNGGGDVSLLVKGNVGIGTADSDYKLNVDGDLRVTGTPYRDGGDIAWVVPSDARLKDVTGDYRYGLKEVAKIDTVRFRYKKDNAIGAATEKEYVGVLAQQVRTLIPEAVETDSRNGYLRLNSSPIFWALVNSAKELNERCEASERKTMDYGRELAAVKAENKDLKDRVERLEALLLGR